MCFLSYCCSWCSHSVAGVFMQPADFAACWDRVKALDDVSWESLLQGCPLKWLIDDLSLHAQLAERAISFLLVIPSSL